MFDILQASATLYHDKILIQTIDRIPNHYSIGSAKVSILTTDSNSEIIGKKTREHLYLSVSDLPPSIDFKKIYSDFLKVSGFKNSKQYHQNARYVSLSQKENLINLIPSKNENGNFLGIKGEILTISKNVFNQELGQIIQSAWAKCEGKCV